MTTTWKDVIKKKLTQSDWSLIIANLIPLIGVWFLDWSAKEVFLVYCLETIIIGFVDFDGIIKKAGKGELKSSGEN